jgi:hypothetical protein
MMENGLLATFLLQSRKENLKLLSSEAVTNSVFLGTEIKNEKI